VTCLKDLSNGDVASGSLDTSIKIWDPSTGKNKKTLKGHTHAIIALEELSNGQLVSSALDKTVVIWNVQSGLISNTLEGFEEPIT
jgi:WD40 repeat protein